MKNIKLVKPSKSIAVAIASVYFFTQILVNPALVASASAASPGNSQMATIWDARALQLPRPMQIPRTQTSLIKPALQNTGPFPFLNPLLIKLKCFSTMGQSYMGRPGSPLVLLVQDIHLNIEAQQNIGKILQTVRDNVDKKLIIGF